MGERIAIYGGSFDPVHFGHLWAAQHALDLLRLDRVIFVPAATSPLKPHGPIASNAQREMMLRLALSGATGRDGHPTMVIDDRELRRGGTSYTIDTVQEIARERPDDELFLLIGSDAFAAIQEWHRPAELLEMITPIVFRRGGEPEIDWNVLTGLIPPKRAEQIRKCSIRLPLIEVSSSDIRERVAQGRGIRFLVPQAVHALIEAESLYQPTVSSPA
jgi:nicotinate-nucleotide adenylyltransferase